jgi:drug/metabolite transporter (DMT)-like permease
MASRRRSFSERLASRLKSETADTIIVAIVLVLTMAFLSGAVYSLATDRPISVAFLRDGSMRVFLWDTRWQTHAETMVVFIYYALGAGGLLLYARAVSRPSDPRTTKYVLFFSFLLLLLSFLGIYSGYLEKFASPS